MFTIVPNLIARAKAFVLTFIVADLEADLVAAAGERKAELLRRADQYDQDDLPTVAEQVRRQAEALVPEKPLAGITAAIADLQTDQPAGGAALASTPSSAPRSPEDSPPTPKKQRRGRA